MAHIHIFEIDILNIFMVRPHTILKSVSSSVGWLVGLNTNFRTSWTFSQADMEKVESLPPADLHFQISA